MNTVVPYRHDIYYRERPTIAVKPDKVLQLNDEVGLHPVMQPLKALYDEGLLTVINNVGYPNPDRSHFRSMDIWQSASDTNEYLTTGWVGRYLDASCKGKDPQPFKTIEVDDTLSLAIKGDELNGLAVLNPKKLYNQTRSGLVKNLSDDHHHDHEPVAYLYKTLAETVSSAEYVYDKSRVQTSRVTYPNHELGRRLKSVAELIQSGVETSVYYVSISGFDTHTNQPGQQERLLGQYAEAVGTFMSEIKTVGRQNDVVLMTFSEFGRRVKQNASNGTNHGTANNVFLIGGGLAGSNHAAGVLNEAPNLANLVDGDLPYSVDFRSIYAALLRDYLSADDIAILGRKFDPLKLV